MRGFILYCFALLLSLGCGPQAFRNALVAQPTIAFSVDTSSVSEGAGTATVSLVVTDPVQTAITIPFTVSGTATDSSDYSFATSEITLEANATTGTLSFNIIDDSLTEATETVIITLGSPSTGSLGSPSAITVSILENEASSLLSGDIVIVAGGTANRTATPYPSHQVVLFGSDGNYKQTLYSASGSSWLWGADFTSDYSRIVFGIENVDRVESFYLSNLIFSSFVADANLGATGANNYIQAVQRLSDGGWVFSESTASIEKFTVSSSGVSTRITTNYPLTTGISTPRNIRRISGGRFIVVQAGGDDRLRIYTDDGATLTQGPDWDQAGCTTTTNCDPGDVIELTDGRFLVGLRTINTLEIYNADFSYAGQAYTDNTVINAPATMALDSLGRVIVCGATFSTCDLFTISGVTATRVGSRSFIDAASLIRTPTSILVVP